jgi:DNA-binding transcriptional regulator YdaS (Cro superfamily)
MTRAVQTVGGKGTLAREIGVSVAVMNGWLDGRTYVPAGAYLRAIEIIADGQNPSAKKLKE